MPMPSNPPYSYQYINTYNGMISPSTIHCRNTQLTAFFFRQLMQKCFSTFQFRGLPDTWDRDYLYYVLYLWGYVCVFYQPEYGVIPQAAALSGYNIYYLPTRAIVCNPHFVRTEPLQLGVEAELIKLTPDYSGFYDIVSYYADMMALTAEAAAVNTINSKLSYVFPAENKAEAESYKAMFDKLSQGDPAVFVRKKADGEDLSQPWLLMTSNAGANQTGTALLQTLQAWEARFLVEIGIPANRVEKRERVNTLELSISDIETKSRSEVCLESLRDSIAKVNKMFDLNITVDWRWDDDIDRKYAGPDGLQSSSI